MFNCKSLGVVLILGSSMVLPSVADAKAPVRHRTHLTAAQVDAAKARMERTGTATIAQDSAPIHRKSCSNISCLGFTTMLGVGY